MGRVKQCELWEGRIEEGMWGRRVNTKDSTKGHMTTYYYRSLLKYINMLICKEIKWNYSTVKQNKYKASTYHRLRNRRFSARNELPRLELLAR